VDGPEECPLLQLGREVSRQIGRCTGSAKRTRRAVSVGRALGAIADDVVGVGAVHAQVVLAAVFLLLVRELSELRLRRGACLRSSASVSGGSRGEAARGSRGSRRRGDGLASRMELLRGWKVVGWLATSSVGSLLKAIVDTDG